MERLIECPGCGSMISRKTRRCYMCLRKVSQMVSDTDDVREGEQAPDSFLVLLAKVVALSAAVMGVTAFVFIYCLAR